jgi:hypothetical protein
MSDLVESLRKAEVSAHVGYGGDWKSIYATAADLIEEQAARIAELQAALDSDPDGSGYWRFWSGKAAEQANLATVSQARLSEAVKVLEDTRGYMSDFKTLIDRRHDSGEMVDGGDLRYWASLIEFAISKAFITTLGGEK